MHIVRLVLRSTAYHNRKPSLSSARLARNFSSEWKPVETQGRVLGSRFNCLTLSRTSAVCSCSFGYAAPLRSFKNARLFSTGNKGEPPEDDPEGKDDGPLFSSQLPATVAVPEVWPQVPVIAINRNPVFPRFIKLIEVNLYH